MFARSEILKPFVELKEGTAKEVKAAGTGRKTLNQDFSVFKALLRPHTADLMAE